MAPALDASAQPTSSLTARRPAATNLGSMSLPPLPFRHTTPQKPMAFNDPLQGQSNGQTSFLNSGSLLTPPSTLSGDTLSPISGLMNGTTVTQSFSAGSPQHWMSNAGSAQSMNAATGMTPPSWTQSTKGHFSPPSAGSLSRTNTTSPTANHGGLPPPPLQQSMPDLGTRYASYASQPGTSMSQAAIAAANQQSFAQNSLLSPTAPQSNTQDGDVAGTLSSSSPLNGNLPTTTANSFQYASFSTPASAQHSNFNFNSQPSPADTLPQQNQYSMPNAQNTYMYRNVGYMPIAGGMNNLQGPVMTNLGNPNQPMALVNVPPGIPYISGYHSGMAANMMTQGQPKTDRPFACNECPQSFNRNHDLKRHKRIHLAVKPFPCDHCDKSFSRKDALKRHILVKSCGSKERKKNESDSPPTEDSSVKGEDSVKSE